MIAILQPHIPHYREMFIKLFSQERKTEIFCYDLHSSKNNQFSYAMIPVIDIPAFQKSSLLIYNPFFLLQKKYDILILMLHFGHISTWILLLTKCLHRKRIILWGQGISVKRYLEEEIKQDWKLKLMLRFADGAWIYTKKEADQWKKVFPHKQIVALNNTLACNCETKSSTKIVIKLKNKYGIQQKRILMFSARFENLYRRTDLLIEVIKRLDPNLFGFIIIGSGSLKPDLSMFRNVYDFGSLYDENIKKELFNIADIYFQPGWVGLSVVEAMSYSLPIFTFYRSKTIKQCVEYSYIINKYNGLLFDSVTECVDTILNISDSTLAEMGENSHYYVRENLSVENMVNNALSIF